MRSSFRTLILLALAITLATGCKSAVPENVVGKAERPSMSPVRAEDVTPEATLNPGGPSGSYSKDIEFDPQLAPPSRTRVHVEFSYPSYFKVDYSPGTVYSIVTLTSGNSRIVLTIHKNTQDAGSVASSLKTAITTWYSQAVFVHQPPRLLIEKPDGIAQGTAPSVRNGSEWNFWPWGTPRIVQMTPGGAVIEEGRIGDPDNNRSWSTWEVGRPEAVPGSESDFEGEEKVVDNAEAYVSNRLKTWDWMSSGQNTSDLFRRNERWFHDKSVWDKYERKAANDEVVQGRTGYCYHGGFRYQVIVETANLGRMVEASGGTAGRGSSGTGQASRTLQDQVAAHVVCFYPESDAPIMADVITLFRNTLRAYQIRGGSNP